MKSVYAWLLAGVMFISAAGAAVPETLKLTDIANRPERLPAKVTLNQEFSFADGSSVKSGQEVTPIEFDGRELIVDPGDGVVFGIPADASNLLDAANAVWATLTPEQRAIDNATLLKDAALWPQTVTSFAGFTLQDGTQIAPGGTFDLIKVSKEGLELYSTENKSRLIVDANQTDIIPRAREVAATPVEQRPSRIGKVLAGKLVNADGSPSAANVEESTVFALYFGASWCGPCRSFSPGFVKYINEISADNPKLTVVLLSNDKKDADMFEYMSEEKMPWGALPLADLNDNPLLLSYSESGIPNLGIVDRFGKVLASSYENGRYYGPKRAQQGLEKILATGAAK
jgi:nucleoredoxin